LAISLSYISLTLTTARRPRCRAARLELTHPAPQHAHLDGAAFAASSASLCAATAVLTLAAPPPACFRRSSLWEHRGEAE
jgi:hypothetical protein